VQAADIGIVPEAARAQSPFTLLLIFAGANIVATTLQVGASLVPAFGLSAAMALIAAGSALGSGLVAALVPLGARYGAPSVVLARAAFGRRGAGLVALLLYVTNFAWIAINNVIAGSAGARVFGGASWEPLWAFALGIVATVVVAKGPRAVGLADKVAVPLLLVFGALLTAACLRLPREVLARPGTGEIPWVRGLDIVIGYQVSWILMFADYSRYTRSAGKGALAAFLGLAVTSLWFMPLGFAAARAASSSDPGAMLAAVHLEATGAALLILATLTTNFVNSYLSALAWKSLFPRMREGVTVWSIGIVGAFLSLLSRLWLERFAAFMLLLGGILVPVGGVLLARFFLVRREVDVSALYEKPGPFAATGGFSVPGLAAWALGGAAYYAAAPVGGTLPSLAAAVVLFWGLEKSFRPFIGRQPLSS